jgi:small subunit ribosomal protein S6
MARRMYEYMFLFDSGKTSGDVMAAVQVLHTTFEKHGGEILASRPWADQRLTYPIRHQKKGLYYLIYVRCDSSKIWEIEGDLKLNETLLRFLTVVIDPKWEEDMLAIAKDEHALALQLSSAEDGDGDYDSPRRSSPMPAAAIPDEAMKN